MTKQSKKLQNTMEKEMHDFKHGKAHSGKGGAHKVTDPKQAQAIAYSKFRENEKSNAKGKPAAKSTAKPSTANKKRKIG